MPLQRFAIWRRTNLLSWPTSTDYQIDKNFHKTSRRLTQSTPSKVYFRSLWESLTIYRELNIPNLFSLKVLQNENGDIEVGVNASEESDESDSSESYSEDDHLLDGYEPEKDLYSEDVRPTKYPYCTLRDCWSKPDISPLCFNYNIPDKYCYMIQWLRWINFLKSLQNFRNS